MKLKIVSDGTVEGTKVIHSETGEVLEGVTLLSWSMVNMGDCEATLHLWAVPCEITAQTDRIIADEVMGLQAFPSLPDEYQAGEPPEDGSQIFVDVSHLIRKNSETTTGNGAD